MEQIGYVAFAGAVGVGVADTMVLDAETDAELDESWVSETVAEEVDSDELVVRTTVLVEGASVMGAEWVCCIDVPFSVQVLQLR